MAGPLIEFICTNGAHRPHHDGEHASTVTVHQGRWAYCDSPVDGGHEWVASGGVPLELLQSRSGAIVQEARSA
jgi:hypothetical protein